jgi:integrase
MSAPYQRQAAEYLAMRRALGARMDYQGDLVLEFGRFLDRRSHRGPITTEIALLWSQAPKSKDPRQTARRLGAIRRFLMHRAGFDPRTEVPPVQLLGDGTRRKPPHIYTDDEICALLDACGRMWPGRGTFRLLAHRTVFALLFATGLRIAEALALDDADVDLDDAVVTVRHGKLGKSRLVPLHPTAVPPLRRYAEERDRVARPGPAFFRTQDHARLTYDAVSAVFELLRGRLGWTRQGRTGRPRIHDIRHTFAVSCLLRWYREGVHPDRRIAHLATYLGHVEVRDTYWYLSVVPELSAIAAERFERYAAQAVRS